MELGTYFIGRFSGLLVGICFGYFAERLITTYNRNCYIKSLISGLTHPILLEIVSAFVTHRYNNRRTSNNLTLNNDRPQKKNLKIYINILLKYINF